MIYSRITAKWLYFYAVKFAVDSTRPVSGASGWHADRVAGRTPSILGRPVYGIAEAAGLLGLRSDRTRAWLDGYERNGVCYVPVIREESTGAASPVGSILGCDSVVRM